MIGYPALITMPRVQFLAGGKKKTNEQRNCFPVHCLNCQISNNIIIQLSCIVPLKKSGDRTVKNFSTSGLLVLGSCVSYDYRLFFFPGKGLLWFFSLTRIFPFCFMHAGLDGKLVLWELKN